MSWSFRPELIKSRGTGKSARKVTVPGPETVVFRLIETIDAIEKITDPDGCRAPILVESS
jgi:hypothetical protein